MNPHVQARWSQACDCLADAQLLLANQRLKAAINRAYYAAFLISKIFHNLLFLQTFMPHRWPC
jgi:uncharacterized protein (UPF0332 family)